MARLLRSEISQHTSDHKPTSSSPLPSPQLNQITQQITKQDKLATASKTTNTMSSQQQQQQSKRKRESSPSSPHAPDESGLSQQQTKRAKVNDDKKVDDDQLPSCGCSNLNDQLEQQRAESKRECCICLEDFYDRTEEGIITACGHVFCLECLGFWRDWLQELEVEVRCPECRGLVEKVDDDWLFDPLLEDD